MLWTSYEPISFGMGFELFDLLLASGAFGLPEACHVLCRLLYQESVFFLGNVFGQLGWTSWDEGFPLLFILWFITIPTIMSHPMGLDYYNDGKCKDCCLGGLCHIRNTLYICTIP